MGTNLQHADSFKDLEVYKRAKELSNIIFEETKSFPKEEKYSLTDQIRRSSRSIGAQIAESWGKRRYVNHFISKLTDADAEAYETQHWLNVSLQCKYLELKLFNELTIKCIEIGRMLNSMINKADFFCQKVH